MESTKLLDLLPPATGTMASLGKYHKANGPATAALLIQIAAEMLETSPALRRRMGITLSDLAAADKVRKELARKTAVA
ncbi:hypothetical protein [Fibrella aquatilis]|uniref:Uncharacterized protein n=1 Tax=Fibrella aquatilis TaxID=2817059 RepID=A0A939JYV9_9BACT|nr:hypothetical protein [Fibrella aquatilis]MBO0932514.1 hypothetical protein [Fibrella aquatilis]